MLEGIRILDLSRLLPGPFCTWMLRGMGAQVDRVEPLYGDRARYIAPFVDDVGVYFASFARGMRSMSIDFRTPETVGILDRMLSQYDVLVEGFRPSTLEQMGISPSELLERHPSLIIARISGYGQQGPLAQTVGHDNNYIGYAGILAGMMQSTGTIALPTVQIADTAGAMSAGMAICAALYAREKSGVGQVLDLSLSDAAVAVNAPMINAMSAEGRSVVPGGEVLSGGLSVYRCYQCADGRWISVGALEGKFQDLLRAEFTALDEQTLRAGFSSRNSTHWINVFSSACVSPVLEPVEVPQHPHFQYRKVWEEGAVQPPIGKCTGPVPKLGEHTTEILLEAGFDSAQIQHFQHEAVIGGKG